MKQKISFVNSNFHPESSRSNKICDEIDADVLLDRSVRRKYQVSRHVSLLILKMQREKLK